MQIAADATDEKPNTNSTSFTNFFFANTCIILEYNTWKTSVKGGSTRGIEREVRMADGAGPQAHRER
jgi:hypothetical protein